MEVNDCLHVKHVCLMFAFFLFLFLHRVREVGSPPSVFQADFNEQKGRERVKNNEHVHHFKMFPG